MLVPIWGFCVRFLNPESQPFPDMLLLLHFLFVFHHLDVPAALGAKRSRVSNDDQQPMVHMVYNSLSRFGWEYYSFISQHNELMIYSTSERKL